MLILDILLRSGKSIMGNCRLSQQPFDVQFSAVTIKCDHLDREGV